MARDMRTRQKASTPLHHTKSHSCSDSAACDPNVSTSSPDISLPNPEAQSTVSIQLSGPIDPYRFNMFMADLLAERGSDIKRMHGMLTIQGYGSHGTYFKFEGSQNMVTFGPTAGMASDSTPAPVSQVTFIGQNLSEQDLREALETCTWLPAAPGWTEHYASGVQQPFYVHQATGQKQWQRPTVVKPESAVIIPATPASHPSPLSQQFAPSASLSQDLDLIAARQLRHPGKAKPSDAPWAASPARASTPVRRRRAGARKAVSCPCNASDACAAAFDIRDKKDRLQAKRLRESSSDVTSKLAELDILDASTGHLECKDSAGSLEEARMGQGKLQKKLSPVTTFAAEMHLAEQALLHSNVCQLPPEQAWTTNRLELSH